MAYSPDRTALLFGVGVAGALLLLVMTNKNMFIIHPHSENRRKLQHRVQNLTGMCQRDEDGIVQHIGVQQLADAPGSYEITEQFLQGIVNV